jgi:hypothetical protein
MFPDLFAFGIPIIFILTELLSGKISLPELPSPEKIEPPQQNFYSIVHIVSMLYSMSHSLVIFFIFAIILTAVSYFRHRTTPITSAQIIPWEMGGWMLHILIDIPTHSTQFYSTPFLWPISDIKFNGISWGSLWFLTLNYIAIIVVYFKYFRKKKEKYSA